MSKIEWTGKTWNPVTGCKKVSPGCENCYAIRMSYRLMHMPATKDKYQGVVEKTKSGKLNWTGKINEHFPSLEYPNKFKKPTTFFVNSMTDLFHEDVSFDFIRYVFLVIKDNPIHTFQILTKRPERAIEFFTEMRSRGSSFGFESPGNVLIGISTENETMYKKRCIYLYKFKELGYTTFLSCEPLLSKIDLMLDGIMGGFVDWVIVGGESGHNARPMHPEWVRTIRDQCKAAKVPFFFKQWGEFSPNCSTDPKKTKAIEVNLLGYYKDYPQPGNSIDEIYPSVTMYRVGKNKTTRFFDDIIHSEIPQI